MAKTIGTAGSSGILHSRCGKPVARVIDGVLHVECTRRGCRVWVPLPGWVDAAKLQRVFELVVSGQVSLDQILNLGVPDPLVSYRQIPGLLVMGPEEIEQAFLRPDDAENPNPLGLSEGWCRTLTPPVPISADELYEKWVKPSQTPEWTDCLGGCKPVLSLMLCEINISGNVQPVSLANLYRWFGQTGLILRPVQLSDWFLSEDLEWVNTPVVLQTCWSMRWLDHPAWTAKKNWESQQRAVAGRQDILGLRLGTGPEELWLMDILIANNLRFREETWTRVSTTYGGCPLEVGLSPDGVSLRRYWNSGLALPHVGAAVAGDLVA